MNQNSIWSPTTKIIIILFVLVGVIWLLIAFQPVLTAIALSALMAYLFHPIINKLAGRTRLKRSTAARLIFVVFLLILGAIPAILGTVVVDQFHVLEVEFLDALIAIEQWISRPIQFLGYRFYPEVIVTNLEQAAGSALATIPEGSLGFLSGFTNNLLWVLLVIFSLYYLMLDGQRLIPWLIKKTPDQYQTDVQNLLRELDEVWGVFLRVQLLMFVILGIMMGAGFLLVIWLFRSGLIPFSPLALILLLILVVTVAQQIDNLWLRPQLMGKSLHMHPGLVFAGLTGALMVGGLLAAFLVVPMMGTIKVLSRYIYHRLFDLPPWDELSIEDNPAEPIQEEAHQKETETE